MIPYFPQPVLSIGGITVHAFGICAALALLTGFALVDRRAKLHGLERNWAGRVYVLTVLAGLLSGFLWSRVQGTPGISSTGLAAGGVACFAVLLLWSGARKPDAYWNSLDIYGFAFPFVYSIARWGCFLAHDHMGRSTDSWLGVRFPGETRFDLGLLYALSSAAVAGFLIWLNRGRVAPGVVSVAAMALLGGFRLEILTLGSATGYDYAAAAGIPAVAAVLWWIPRRIAVNPGASG
jgi:phosphatidylglycerol:prolipoprotein diacylglycerol transferase